MRLALYIRISLGDDDLGGMSGKQESDSITNQRDFLRQYIKTHEEFKDAVITEYFDDGYTGRDFERPGFQDMLKKCRAGEVDCIMVKDLSRIGRHYVEVGNLLEQIFPSYGVRVIAVNDGYDSDKYVGQTGGMDVAFKNLIYNLYSRDLSKKKSSALHMRMKKGEFIGTWAPYGFIKDPEDKHHLLIDPEVSGVVKRIFEEVAAGKRRMDIARGLNEDEIPVPSEYKYRKDGVKRRTPDMKKNWTGTTIARIIRDERYIGNLVQYRDTRVSHQSKKRKKTDPSEWIRVENTHDAIVNKELFDKANSVLRSPEKVKRHHGTEKDYTVLFCPHCGHRLMHYKVGDMCYCPNFRYEENSPCKDIYIEKSKADEILLLLVQRQAEQVLEAREALAAHKMDESGRHKLELALERINAEVARGYREYRDGKYSREQFKAFSLQKQEEREEIEHRLQELEKKRLAAEALKESTKGAFDICRYIGIEEYDAKVMAALFDKVYVLEDGCMEVHWKHEDSYKMLLG